MKPFRLAIIVSHPIQYYAPWFARLSKCRDLDVKVFYLWNPASKKNFDPEFGCTVEWDIDLLSGYEHEFVRNTSRDPGTHHFSGLSNPELAQRVQEYDPEAILLFGYKYQSHLSLLFSPGLVHVPFMFRGDSHRLGVSLGLGEVCKRAVLAALFRRFESFLYVGRANRAYFIMHGVNPRKLHFVPHAVDSARFGADLAQVREEGRKWRHSLGIPDGSLVFLFAGKLSERKGVLQLVDAFHKASLSDAVLIIAGSGALDTILRSRASNGVSFAPFQNQSSMPRTYAAADVVVLPSLYGETWGLMINEAMALGIPAIVSSAVGCAEDLVRHAETGLVVPPNDVRALAEALREAASDRQRLRHWGARAAKLISDEYSYEKQTDGLLEALRAVGRPRRFRCGKSVEIESHRAD